MWPNQANNQALQLRSTLPGRERWSIAALRRKPQLAQQLALRLKQQKGLIEVSANPATGRILVIFDQQRIKTTIGLIIAAEIEKLVIEQITTKKSKDPAESSKTFELVKSVESSRHLRYRSMGLSLLNSIGYMALPLSMGMIMSVPLIGKNRFLSQMGFQSLEQIGLFGGAFILIRGAVAKLDYTTKNQWQNYATDIEHNLRVKVFSHIETLDMAYLENQNTSQLVNLVHDDVVKIRKMLEVVPHSAIDKVNTLTLGSLMAMMISPLPFLLTLTPLPIIYYLFRKYHKEIAQKYELQSVNESANKQLLSNDFSGFSTIKCFATEEYERQRLIKSSEKIRQSKKEAYAVSTYYTNSTQYAIATGVALPMAFAGGMVSLGMLAPAVYLPLCFALPRVMMIMSGLDLDYDLHQDALSATQRLSTLLDTRAQIIDGDIELPIDTVRGELCFRQVSFAYTPKIPLFNHLDLTIAANKTTAFVGTTGSGKTTIIKLLLRLYDINEGQILLDDQDIRQLKINDLRNSIGLVSQDVFLFHGSIYENIHYSRMDASYEEVVAATKAAGILDFINSLPDGFATLIGERGQKLSGGQRQRISIARVMLKNPPILILDEATSSVDNETEATIQRSIERIAQGKTMIVIAHRLSTIQNADQIHVIEQGRTIESGTHKQLVNLNQSYAALWRLQTGNQSK